MGLFDEYFEKHRLNEPQTPECINTRKATNHIKAHLFHVSAAKLHLILRTKEELKDQQFFFFSFFPFLLLLSIFWVQHQLVK